MPFGTVWFYRLFWRSNKKGYIIGSILHIFVQLDECGLEPHGWPFARNNHINLCSPNLSGSLTSRLKNKNTLPAPCIIQHKSSRERREVCLLWIIPWLVLIWFFLVDWHLVITTNTNHLHRICGFSDNRIVRIRTFYPTRLDVASSQYVQPSTRQSVLCAWWKWQKTRTHIIERSVSHIYEKR